MTNIMLWSAGDAAAGGVGGTILMVVVMLALMYFMAIRPQKKREKQQQAMRESLDIGDEITTIGGIIGTVVSKRDDHVVIETSNDRNKIRITTWAIQTNNTANEAAAADSSKK